MVTVTFRDVLSHVSHWHSVRQSTVHFVTVFITPVRCTCTGESTQSSYQSGCQCLFSKNSSRSSNSDVHNVRSGMIPVVCVTDNSHISACDYIAVIVIVIRPPDVIVGGLGFYCDSSIFFYLFSSAILRARWTELNQNRPHARKSVRFRLKMYVQNVRYPLPCKSGAPKTTLFRRLRNLTATLMAHIFEISQDIHNPVSALETTRGLLHYRKISWTFVHKRA